MVIPYVEEEAFLTPLILLHALCATPVSEVFDMHLSALSRRYTYLSTDMWYTRYSIPGVVSSQLGDVPYSTMDVWYIRCTIIGMVSGQCGVWLDIWYITYLTSVFVMSTRHFTCQNLAYMWYIWYSLTLVVAVQSLFDLSDKMYMRYTKYSTVSTWATCLTAMCHVITWSVNRYEASGSHSLTGRK